MGKVPVVPHEGKDHVSLRIEPPAWTAVDFIDAFCVANYLRQTVKGTHSVAGDVTSASANLEKQTSHGCTQLLAFSSGVFKVALSEQRWRGTRELLTHAQVARNINLWSTWEKLEHTPSLKWCAPSCLLLNEKNCFLFVISSSLTKKRNMIFISYPLCFDPHMIHNFVLAGNGLLLDKTDGNRHQMMSWRRSFVAFVVVERRRLVAGVIEWASAITWKTVIESEPNLINGKKDDGRSTKLAALLLICWHLRHRSAPQG